MRTSDRPGAGSLEGGRADLSARLSRLPDAHPSSPRDPAGELESEDKAAEDAAPDELRPDELEAEADLTEPGPDDGEPTAEAGTDRPRPPLGQPGVRAAGGTGPRERYRPWFTDGGPGEPWFAAGTASPDG